MVSVATEGGLLFESVGYRFGSRRRARPDALREFSLACGRGSIACMIGPNGAGKSTALALAAGLIGSADGCVYFGDRSVTPFAPPARFGYLPQASAFPGALTVGEVLALACDLRCTPAADREAVTRVTGLGPALSSPTRTLSSGWTRRLGLAVALAPPTDLLLLDEPFVGLDIETLDRVIEYLRQRHRHGATILLASHDYETADRLDPRIVVLSEGRLIGDAPTGADGARASYRRIVASSEAGNDAALPATARAPKGGEHAGA